jgi:hypothetical protein
MAMDLRNDTINVNRVEGRRSPAGDTRGARFRLIGVTKNKWKCVDLQAKKQGPWIGMHVNSKRMKGMTESIN